MKKFIKFVSGGLVLLMVIGIIGAIAGGGEKSPAKAKTTTEHTVKPNPHLKPSDHADNTDLTDDPNPYADGEELSDEVQAERDLQYEYCEENGWDYIEPTRGPEDAGSCKDTKGAAKMDAEVEALEEELVESTKPDMTLGQENALEAAESYLDGQAFSRTGLIQQLKFEEYSKADAVYAVNHVEVNWTKEAKESAKSYMDGQNFSASSLQDQLEFEGFTSAQAAAGVAAVGY